MDPALTPDEWSELRFEPLSNDRVVVHDDGDGLEIVVYASDADRAERKIVEDKFKLHDWAPTDRHALAALALYGQPFGFTPEDVKMLFMAMNYISDGIGFPELVEYQPKLGDLADRIEALLPPRDG